MFPADQRTERTAPSTHETGTLSVTAKERIRGVRYFSLFVSLSLTEAPLSLFLTRFGALQKSLLPVLSRSLAVSAGVGYKDRCATRVTVEAASRRRG